MAQSWTKRRVRDKIHGLYKSAGKINSWYVQTHYNLLYQAGIRKFGSWRSSVEAAGFKWNQVRKRGGRTIWTKEVIVAKIIEIKLTEGQINSNYMQLNHGSLYTAARREFGKYAAAVDACGLNYQEILRQDFTPHWSKKRIAAELRRRYRAGEFLNGFAVQKAAPGFYQKTRNRFGKNGWNKALEFAGFDPFVIQRLTKWTDQTIRKEIRRLYARKTPLNFTYIRKNRYDLFMATLKRGGWANAVEDAGISYFDQCQIWSTKAWLRKLSKADVTKLKRSADRQTLIQRKRERKRR